MAGMQKMTAAWAGFAGAPGVTSIFLLGTTIQDPNVFRTFLNAFAPYIPNTVTIQVAGQGELVDAASGQVTGTWSGSTPATITGSQVGGSLSVATGPLIRLETGAFRRGKHIRGRIFLVPSGSGALASTGTLSTTVQSALQAAANVMLTNFVGQLAVWHRPLVDRTVKPPVQLQPGEALPCTALDVRFKLGVLRSRRD